MNDIVQPPITDVQGLSTVGVDITNNPEIEMKEKNPIDEAIELFSLGDSDFEEALPGFIEKRASVLTKEEHSPDTIKNDSEATGSFISSDTKMIRNDFDKEFYLDDPTAYATLIRFTRSSYDKFIHKGLPPIRAFYQATINGTYHGQASYFGSYYGDLNALVSMTGDFLNDDPPEIDGTHIANLKKVAVCMERSGVVHNALKILGVDSRLEVGSLYKENADRQPTTEAHVFITFNNPQGERVLYDPANPIRIIDSGGNVVAMQPFTVKIIDGAKEVNVPIPTKTKAEDGSFHTTSTFNAVYEFN
ncbi:hypothetical protein KC960_00935 [Candidatus Saccharibacteria bacterium]|nr:hypothetical protein [Candidatus Saccharibacteria bacterium]